MSSSGSRDRKRQCSEPLSPNYQDRQVVVDYADSMDGMTDMDEQSQTGDEEISAIFTWRGYKDEVYLPYLHEFMIGENVDVTIEHNSGFVDFHRDIVAAASPYLIRRVEELERAQEPTLVEISAKPWLLKNLADLLYTGEVAVERRYVSRLYHFLRFLEVDFGVNLVDENPLKLNLTPREEMHPDMVLALASRVLVMGGPVKLIQARYNLDMDKLRAYVHLHRFQYGEAERLRLSEIVMRFRAYQKQEDQCSSWPQRPSYIDDFKGSDDDENSNASAVSIAPTVTSELAAAEWVLSTDDDETRSWWSLALGSPMPDQPEINNDNGNDNGGNDKDKNKDKDKLDVDESTCSSSIYVGSERPSSTSSAAFADNEEDMCFCGRGFVSPAYGGSGRSCAACVASGLVIEPSANDQQQQREIRKREQIEEQERQRLAAYNLSLQVSIQQVNEDPTVSPTRKRRKIDPDVLFNLQNMIKWFAEHSGATKCKVQTKIYVR
uniref:BTB domain-containing protein n=1 Tax=Trichogramma kaykai TaxID=54128 RepID=A0ABD2XTV0_9HYME